MEVEKDGCTERREHWSWERMEADLEASRRERRRQGQKGRGDWNGSGGGAPEAFKSERLGAGVGGRGEHPDS